MKAADIIQIIEKELPQYFSGLIQEVRTNLGTSHYRRLSDEELSRRIVAVYHHLEEWIAGREDSAIRIAGEDLGKRRFDEGVPLGQVVLALVLEEKYLSQFLSNAGVSLEGEWAQVIVEYFQKMIYHTARGYETALAQSNRLAQRATVPLKAPEPAKLPSRTKADKPESDMEISRGGEIGEVGG
ncbi:MAG: hypothetical protein A3J28_13245 [Acidobacteria bacterium RIFCSPLOWO2_12_FULL_60_22]|nr:MAG: hypothetical protein A3J28_13245 [Acidobacteria bacterium RIFCSPLOWO2_12_FULL_60_22]